MTIVNVVLTPNVDTDQTASAQSQIQAAPSGTAGNPTIINMPAGRYRINGRLILSRRKHIRWTCLAGEPTYPNPPSDSQAFVAYTDLDGLELGIKDVTGRSTRIHFTQSHCTDVVGSFLRAEGPNVTRNPINPLYPKYSPTREGEHAFGSYVSDDSGWEDCSYKNVWGDGLTVDGYDTDAVPLQQTNRNSHCYRLVGAYAGRMLLGIINCDGLDVVDAIDNYTGYGGVDFEPNPQQITWNVTLTRVKAGCWFYPITLTGESSQTRFSASPRAKKDITIKDFTVLRSNTLTVPGFAVLTRVGGLLTIDGLIDLRNRGNCGLNWFADMTNYTDNVTIKNCRIIEQTTQTSYAIQVKCTNTLTVTNNNFSGSGITGFDNLATLSNVDPLTYVHYGNIWGNGTLNDGTGPTGTTGTGTIRPGKPGLHGTGTASTQAQGHIEGAEPVLAGIGSVAFVDEEPAPAPTIGGLPFRLRQRKRAVRVRGSTGPRLRGVGGPAERYVARVRGFYAEGVLRSRVSRAGLRSDASAPTVTGTGAVAGAAASFAGHGAGIGALTAPAASLAGTGTETISGAGAFAPANTILAGTGAESEIAFGNLAAAAASFAGTGAEGGLGTGAVRFAAAAFAGTGSETISGVGPFAPGVPGLAGAGTETLPPGTGAITAAKASLSGTSTLEITGTGTFDPSNAVLAGSGEGNITHEGPGALEGSPAALAGIGTFTITGTGAIAAVKAALAGAGTGVMSGTGAIAATAATLAGAGSEVISTGTGNLATSPAALAGTGSVSLVGVGALAPKAPRLAGIWANLIHIDEDHVGDVEAVPFATAPGKGSLPKGRVLTRR
jgi:hypothetical protein